MVLLAAECTPDINLAKTFSMDFIFKGSLVAHLVTYKDYDFIVAPIIPKLHCSLVPDVMS